MRTLLVILFLTSVAVAQTPRKPPQRDISGDGVKPDSRSDSLGTPDKPVKPSTANAALDEVNALRRARGIPELVFDATLAEAAQKCAEWRAARGVSGHTPNDFDFLPDRNYRLAVATGCAAWDVGDRFAACGLFDPKYKVAGAAVVEKNGKRYTHVFYR